MLSSELVVMTQMRNLQSKLYCIYCTFRFLKKDAELHRFKYSKQTKRSKRSNYSDEEEDEEEGRDEELMLGDSEPYSYTCTLLCMLYIQALSINLRILILQGLNSTFTLCTLIFLLFIVHLHLHVHVFLDIIFSEIEKQVKLKAQQKTRSRSMAQDEENQILSDGNSLHNCTHPFIVYMCMYMYMCAGEFSYSDMDDEVDSDNEEEALTNDPSEAELEKLLLDNLSSDEEEDGHSDDTFSRRKKDKPGHSTQ